MANWNVSHSIGLAVGLAISGAVFFTHVAQDEHSPNTFIQGKTHVYDGGGVYVDDVKIRLWGIETPDIGTKSGDVSYASLAEYVDGRWLRCKPPPGTSEFPVSGSHKVALCTFRGDDIARYQIRNGHAHDWSELSDGYYRR